MARPTATHGGGGMSWEVARWLLAVIILGMTFTLGVSLGGIIESHAQIRRAARQMNPATHGDEADPYLSNVTKPKRKAF